MNRNIDIQPSERWAVYELVCPILDAANGKSGLRSYYEFPMISKSGRRLSADVALVDRQDRAIWLVEVKKISRPLNKGFIEPYLKLSSHDGTMGVVTNGNRWIFSIDDMSWDIGRRNILAESKLYDKNTNYTLFKAASGDEINSLIQVFAYMPDL